jgi:class 3 adenylate cyclase/HAMP domain-containing protein
MKLRTIFSALFATLIVLAGANLVLAFFLGEADRRRNESESQLNEITSLSEDLVISSQWATRFARGYVTTRDPIRLRYYNEVMDIFEGRIARPRDYGWEYWDFVDAKLLPEPENNREGAISLEDQFLRLNLTIDEFNIVKKAEALILKMSFVERRAMHAALGEFDDGTGSFAKKGKPDPTLAEKLLYGESYLKDNGELSKLVYDLKGSVGDRYSGILDQNEKFASELIKDNIYLGGALLSIVLAYMLFLRMRFLQRTSQLMSAVEEISKGQLDAEVSVSGRDEIGELAAAIGFMTMNLKNAFKVLEEKVSMSERTAIELNNERMRSEKLLHNILPATIAQRLQGGEAVIAEVFPEVTVFFSDIVGFTELASKLGPHETVDLLNTLFEKFDDLVETFEVEKIKTIGDSYMVVGGLPSRDPLHCQHIAAFALEALAFVKSFSSIYPYAVQMRMGIHTGTVAAGVLGKKKFSYDLWGDVVNIASRYENSSTPNNIHVSEAVRVRLADDFIFSDEGSVELKGKGIVPSYYLLGKKTAGHG